MLQILQKTSYERNSSVIYFRKKPENDNFTAFIHFIFFLANNY